MNIIETRNLTKSYGKARGIIDVSLSVKEGEFFGFIGPNGAGKSTTIRTLLGLIAPTSGEAFVFGKPVTDATQYLKDIGYMPSEAMFYHGMKVRDIITFSAGMRKTNCTEEAKLLCERLDLNPDKKIEALSLGNRKKVAIVCAMQHKPKLYIFDEPTSGLDPLMQKEFFSLLEERAKEGATIFFSSHVLSEVQHHCSKTAIIRAGELVAVDTMENLSRTNTKRVTLHGIHALPESLAAKSVNISENTINFLYQGEMKMLISALQGLPITDMTIAEPELEEIFLHYYEKGGER